VAGEKISALEIENRMSEHPQLGCGGGGHAESGPRERICAYVTLKPGAKLSGNEIITFLKDKGASVQQLLREQNSLKNSRQQRSARSTRKRSEKTSEAA